MAAEMWPRPRGHPEGKFLFFRNCGSLCPGVVEEESVSTVTVINSRANMDHVPLLISRFPALISLRTLVMAPAITAATHCRSPKMQDNQESPQNLPQPGTGTIPVPTRWGRCQEWLKATPPDPAVTWAPRPEGQHYVVPVSDSWHFVTSPCSQA